VKPQMQEGLFAMQKGLFALAAVPETNEFVEAEVRCSRVPSCA
jgi:hypothetical protein